MVVPDAEEQVSVPVPDVSVTAALLYLHGFSVKQVFAEPFSEESVSGEPVASEAAAVLVSADGEQVQEQTEPVCEVFASAHQESVQVRLVRYVCVCPVVQVGYFVTLSEKLCRFVYQGDKEDAQGE